MEEKIPSETDILDLAIQSYGKTNLLKHYNTLLSQVANKMKSSAAEQNPMLMAEQNALIREITRKINHIVNYSEKSSSDAHFVV